MTAAQFVRRNDSYFRETSSAYVTFLLPSLIFGPALVVAVYLLNVGVAATVGAAILGVCWMVGGLAELRRGAYWRARGLQLLCPSCGAPLMARASEADVDGHCPRCGAVWIEPAGGPEHALITQGQFANERGHAVRVQGRDLAVWMIVALALPVGFAFLAMFDWVPRAHAEGWFAAAVAALMCGAVVMAVLESIGQRSDLLACPDCRRPLVNKDGEARLADGRCPGCHLLIVGDSAPVPPPAPSAHPNPPATHAPPANAAALEARSERLEWGTRRDYAITIPLALGVIVAARVLALTQPVGTPWVFVSINVACLAAIAMLVFANRIWERRARRLGLVCPACGELLVGGRNSAVLRFALSHGACKFCGATLWAETPPRAASPG